MDEHATKPPPRRVYKPELMRRTGYRPTWLRHLEQSGRIPVGRTDPGCKRKFWLADEADAIVEGIPQREAAEREAITAASNCEAA
jgi:hypothetical protein